MYVCKYVCMYAFSICTYVHINACNIFLMTSSMYAQYVYIFHLMRFFVLYCDFEIELEMKNYLFFFFFWHFQCRMRSLTLKGRCSLS